MKTLFYAFIHIHSFMFYISVHNVKNPRYCLFIFNLSFNLTENTKKLQYKGFNLDNRQSSCNSFNSLSNQVLKMILVLQLRQKIENDTEARIVNVLQRLKFAWVIIASKNSYLLI